MANKVTYIFILRQMWWWWWWSEVKLVNPWSKGDSPRVITKLVKLIHLRSCCCRYYWRTAERFPAKSPGRWRRRPRPLRPSWQVRPACGSAGSCARTLAIPRHHQSSFNAKVERGSLVVVYLVIIVTLKNNTLMLLLLLLSMGSLMKQSNSHRETTHETGSGEAEGRRSKQAKQARLLLFQFFCKY